VIRQRIHLRTPALAYLVRLLTVLFGLALVWYGAMVVLLAVKVSPHTVNSISAYRTLYHDIVGLTPADFTTRVRLIAGFGGFLAFLVLVYLALQELPRPYLARGPVTLQERPQGETVARPRVARPRALERTAEIAAQSNPNVTAAAGRLGEAELAVNISTSRASLAAETLTDVQARVRAALDRHELPDLPVNVTLTGYDRKTRRELA
jgi:hypothetical protein